MPQTQQSGMVIGPEMPVTIALKLAKVDKEKREVEGIATQEIRDVSNEIVDHESMKAVLAAWPGNIREMHQPKAVGKAVKVISDDELKATIVRSYVSKGAPDTWEKVLDGTLSMYSIGGTGKRITTKNAAGESENRILMTALHEISLVDNGACPTAKFQIVKFADGECVECQPAELPEEPTAQPSAAELPADVRARRDVVARLLPGLTTQKATKALAAHQVASAAIATLETAPAAAVQKTSYPTPWMIEQTLCAIACLERIVAEEWWKAEGAEGSETDRLQLEVLKNAIELVLAYLLSEFSAQFEKEPEDDALALARRATLVDTVEKALPAVWGKVDGTGQLWFAKRGARHSAADMQMVQAMHDTSVTLGAACSMPETDEEKAAAAAKSTISVNSPAPAVPVAPATEKAVPASQAPAAPVIAQASEAQPIPPAAPAIAAPSAAVQQAVGLTPEQIQTLVDSAVAKATQALQATSDVTIAELRSQITKLSNEPVPGGPKARATGTEGTPVMKTLGNGAGALPDVDPALVVAFAQELAKSATTEGERSRIVENLLRFQHMTGTGAVALRTPPKATT